MIRTKATPTEGDYIVPVCPLLVGSQRTARPDALVEKATVDAYGDDEQLTALYTMIDLPLPTPRPVDAELIDAYRH